MPNQSEQHIYCPYTDKDIPKILTSKEHIIPLSLGGDSRFALPVDESYNKAVGSKIDGQLANDFLMLLKRRDYNAMGHTKKDPKPIIKNATDVKTGRPIQVVMGKQLQIFDAIDRREVPISGQQINLKIKMNIDLPTRFIAKVFLAAGFLVYGDLFRNSVAHHEARLMLQDPQELPKDKIMSVGTRVFTPFQGELEQEQQLEYNTQRLVCEKVKGCCVVFCLSPSSLCMYCGVLGTYLGMLNVPADTSNFPRFDEHDMGHAIIISNSNVLRWSHRRLLQRIFQ